MICNHYVPVNQHVINPHLLLCSDSTLPRLCQSDCHFQQHKKHTNITIQQRKTKNMLSLTGVPSWRIRRVPICRPISNPSRGKLCSSSEPNPATTTCQQTPPSLKSNSLPDLKCGKKPKNSNQAPLKTMFFSCPEYLCHKG